MILFEKEKEILTLASDITGTSFFQTLYDDNTIKVYRLHLIEKAISALISLPVSQSIWMKSGVLPWSVQGHSELFWHDLCSR